MMALSLSREDQAIRLSREEQEELARSKKKVKDVRHAGFHDGHESGPSSPNHGVGPWNQSTSLKDKLVGEILGAYTQALKFGAVMEDDAELNEEVENLRQ